jgi:hypothetical protein
MSLQQLSETITLMTAFHKGIICHVKLIDMSNTETSGKHKAFFTNVSATVQMGDMDITDTPWHLFVCIVTSVFVLPFSSDVCSSSTQLTACRLYHNKPKIDRCVVVVSWYKIVSEVKRGNLIFPLSDLSSSRRRNCRCSPGLWRHFSHCLHF